MPQDTDTPESGQASEAAEQPDKQQDPRPVAGGDATETGAEATATERQDGAAGDSSAGETIAALQLQLEEAKDQALRHQAEIQNIRRRAERDVESAHKFGVEKLVNGLLPVLDNLDRALAAVEAAGNEDEAASIEDAVKSILEGIELTRKSAVDALKPFKVEVLEPVGEPFDPQFHEAMTMVPSATAEPNSVIDVLQKGYVLNGRLLRAAMVVVAKAPD